MAEIKDEVMKMVRKELEKNPDVENKDLFAKATKIDGSIEDLTLRQFHARYPLQVKRQKAQKSGGRKKKRKKEKKKKTKSSASGTRGGKRAGASTVDREKIRGTLLRFAKEVSAASGKAEMVDLITNVDEYVDEVVKALDGR